MISYSAPFSVAILAGGQGLRMGGKDKGWVRFRGRALIEHLHHLVRPLTDDFIISCNRNQQAYAKLADQLVSDPTLDFSGPLIGIIESLKVAKHARLVILPCDAPYLDRALIEQLATTTATDNRPLALCQDGYCQPLFSCFAKTHLPKLQQLWQQGERSPAAALKALNVQLLPCTSQDPRLTNFNDPSFLQEPLCSPI